MEESWRKKGKELIHDSYFVPLRSEATIEAAVSCSLPVPDEQEEERREKKSQQLAPKRQLVPKRRRVEPLKPPPGFRFQPTDHELTFKYLYRKKMYNSVPYDCIREVNVYAAHPRKLTEEFMKWGAEGKWYFFSTRERKYPLGDRPARHTIDRAGNWKATGNDKKMYDDSIPHVCGVKRTLIFYEGRNANSARTNWTMHEYITVDDREVKGKEKKKKKNREPPTDMKLDDCVLCTIQRKRGAPEEDESEDGAINAESNQLQSPPPSNRGKRKMRMTNPDGANANHQQQIVLPGNHANNQQIVLPGNHANDQQIVLPGNHANDQQIVLPGNAEHGVIDANASNQQIVLTGEEYFGSRPENRFAGHIDSATTTPEEDIENQYCFYPEEQILPEWDPRESLRNLEGDLHSILRPALPAPRGELDVPDDWSDHMLCMSALPDSCSQGNNSKDDPERRAEKPRDEIS